MIENFIKAQDSLQVISDTKVGQLVENKGDVFVSFWFWMALLELIVIVILIVKSKKSKKELVFGHVRKDKIKEAQSASIDMDGLMGSINGAKKMYKELSKVCHPDRFINSDKKPLAEVIFQDITKHRRNLEKLIELKYEAETKLGVKFKS